MKAQVLLSVRIREERDIVAARARAKQLAGKLGVRPQDATRFATAVSELARNAYMYAGGGQVEYRVEPDAQRLWAHVTDRGPGIEGLQAILDGHYTSSTGMGVGLAGARRLVDAFEIRSAPGEGTQVRVAQRVPITSTLTPDALARLVAELVRETPGGPLDELRLQNQELLSTLNDLAHREEQLRVLNRELEDTNRGVVALYSELEDKAERLRTANHARAMFLSYMSHEFRTPLNSILGLTRMLLDEHDGPLNAEQRKQVTLAQGAARELLGTVNDLLDVAKVEAGKTEVYAHPFDVTKLFGTLRALFQPLLTNPAVRLVFEDAQALPPVVSDEGKVGQILRNYIANALKFTEQGEVRVGAHLTPDGRAVEFHVTDTGVGITPEDQAQLFLEFQQVQRPTGQRAPGTGLGLSLARKLAELLGGHVRVDSSFGHGSRFSATLPLTYAAPEPGAPGPAGPPAPPGGAARRVLLIDDTDTDRFLLRALLTDAGYDVDEASDGTTGLQRALLAVPDAILLDLAMPDMSGFEVLRALRAEERTRTVPVIVVSTWSVGASELAHLRSADADFVPKHTLYLDGRDVLLRALQRIT